MNDQQNYVDNDTLSEVVYIEELNIDYTFEIINQNKIKFGDSLGVSFLLSDTIKLDSIDLFINEKRQTGFTSDFEYKIATNNLNVGMQTIRLEIYAEGKYKEVEKSFVLYSDIVPKNKTYKVKNSYKHDPEAYTQGLFYHDGILYESTGLETRSSLRKVNVETGEVINSIIIPNNFFGEGITIFNDVVYQITWQDHVAFSINKDNLGIISEFSYSTEGWGITNDDTYLYMSDGSNNIQIIDPGTFSVVDIIQVYDNENRMMYLNELEMINGLIYANVYTADFIVVIDPATGKVLEKIDLSGILPNALITPQTDVLNGIAYDAENDRIFITGKNWPRLFEVEFK